MDLVIFAHPDNRDSHNAMVLKMVTDSLKSASREFSVIDLYKDKFNPALTYEEYKMKGTDLQVQGYQKRILSAQRLVFIYPTWWNSLPAMMKGFADRVFTPGFSYNFKPTPGWISALNSVGKYFLGSDLAYTAFRGVMPVTAHLKGKKAVVINTFGGEEVAYRFYHHTPLTTMDRGVLELCGISVKRVNWFNCQKDTQIPQQVEQAITNALEL